MPGEISIYELIKKYQSSKPDFTQYIRQQKPEPREDLEQKVEELNLSEETRKEIRREQARKNFEKELGSFRPTQDASPSS
jgi:hypothetical protein